MIVSLSRLFSFSSVYFKAMPLLPVSEFLQGLFYHKSKVFANRLSCGVRHNAYVPGDGYDFYTLVYLRHLKRKPDISLNHQNCTRNSLCCWPCTAAQDIFYGSRTVKNFSVLHNRHPISGGSTDRTDFGSDRQPLHQPTELLGCQQVYFFWIARPLKSAFRQPLIQQEPAVSPKTRPLIQSALLPQKR